MKKIFFWMVFFPISMSVFAQEWKWHNPQQTSFPVIQNQGWTDETGRTYTRLPQRAEGSVREPVWSLAQNSAGLAIHFYSNAPEIQVRYAVVDGRLNMPHQPTTGMSGVDLYSINSSGEWHFCFGNSVFECFGNALKDTILYHYNRIDKDPYHARGYEYRLYLPLYNSVKWLEIGVPESASFEFIPVSPHKPIVLYGTSITQGGCAGRPAMAWGTIVGRALDYPVINLGFSGNGTLESEILTLMNEIDARMYILDCLANLDSEESVIIRRTIDAVRLIRKRHTAPILLLEFPGYSNEQTDTLKYLRGKILNEASRKACEIIQSEGVKDIYYVSKEELNISPDGRVDHVHLSDLGMQEQADAVEKKIRDILRLPKGKLKTEIPVTQRREPDNYEWQKRHREVLALNQSNPPKAVILGNSITHFWGGEPVARHRNGVNSWDACMKPAGFRNQGYGWDRIENVLWRVYHDELDGFDAEKIVLMIGTNNMGFSTDDEIVEGLHFLLSAIRDRQPKASIKVIGILPRRGKEDWVRNINVHIRQMTEKEGYLFLDAGKDLSDKNGKINDSLFIDGLHPNEKGYAIIGKLINN